MNTRPALVAKKSVLCLTRDMILAIDLEQAIYNVGLIPVLEPASGIQYAAVIVDTDKLNRRMSALVRWHRQAHVPILAIADTERRAKQVGGPAVNMFRKPLSSDDIALCARVLLEDRNASPANDEAPQRDHPA